MDDGNSCAVVLESQINTHEVLHVTRTSQCRWLGRDTPLKLRLIVNPCGNRIAELSPVLAHETNPVASLGGLEDFLWDGRIGHRRVHFEHEREVRLVEGLVESVPESSILRIGRGDGDNLSITLEGSYGRRESLVNLGTGKATLIVDKVSHFVHDDHDGVPTTKRVRSTTASDGYEARLFLLRLAQPNIHVRLNVKISHRVV